MISDLIEKMADVLECESSELTADTCFRDHANWDSLAHLSTMSMIDEEYDVRIGQDEFTAITTLGQLADRIATGQKDG